MPQSPYPEEYLKRRYHDATRRASVGLSPNHPQSITAQNIVINVSGYTLHGDGLYNKITGIITHIEPHNVETVKSLLQEGREVIIFTHLPKDSLVTLVHSDTGIEFETLQIMYCSDGYLDCTDPREKHQIPNTPEYNARFSGIAFSPTHQGPSGS